MGKKKTIAILLIVIVLISAAVIVLLLQDRHESNWTHKTFRGTVVDIWTEKENTIFSIELSGTDTVKNFIVDEDTIYQINFEVGKYVLIESDYDMHKHNGDDVPYPAVMIVDPSIEDNK